MPRPSLNKVYSQKMKANLIHIDKESSIPLIGNIFIGIIDRGTNLLQIRPTTVCQLNCLFCSTDAGPYSKTHHTNFEVEPDYLINELEKAIRIKNCDIEANIDSVGETSAYPYLVKLVKGIKKLDNVKKISMQTNGICLSKELIKKLKLAGLNKINLSIHSLNGKKAKMLADVSSYDVEKIEELAKEIVKCRIELCITPVYLPKINDVDIEEIIAFAKSINASLGIQKYEEYRYSRKMRGVKQQNWWKFYNYLKILEKKHNVKLVLDYRDFGIEKCRRIPEVFGKGDKIHGIVRCKGWMANQVIATANDRCISINNCDVGVGSKIRIRILETKNNIYIGELLN